MKRFKEIYQWCCEPRQLFFLFIIVLAIPNVALFFTEQMPLLVRICIIRKTRRSRFQNEAFRFLGLFPKRSVSFFTKFERHSDGLPIQFECRFFIAFCGEKVSARIAGLAFFLYLYIVVRMGHYSLLSYVE